MSLNRLSFRSIAVLLWALLPAVPTLADEASEAYETSLAMQLSNPVAALISALPRNVTMIHQERAFTSPIWYSPA